MPLPPNWEVHESKSHPGAFYYFNTYISLFYTITGRVTGQSTWEEPIDEVSGFFLFFIHYSLQKFVVVIFSRNTGIFRLHSLIFRQSRNPSSWRNPEITCSKEEAIAELSSIRQYILNSGNLFETFKHVAEKESDCSR